MPDLGKYAAEVYAAYGATFVLLAVLVALTWARAARIRRQLQQAEEERRHG
ncbi:heme exporter protein CcmD [Oceaniglobus trochenteri]|uniref:heme exporter protein CcmD n=1 Tax=Oceaniglobus trochenteri TaxID=2763260 RepID=UPI003CC9422C